MINRLCLLLLLGGIWGCGENYPFLPDDNRNLRFMKIFGGVEDDQSQALLRLPDGGFLLTGSVELITRASGGDLDGDQDLDVYLVRTDARGNLLWSRLLTGEETDSKSEVGVGLVPFGNGYAIIANAQDTDAAAASSDMFLLQVDGQGQLTDTVRRYQSPSDPFGPLTSDDARGLVALADGGLLIFGISSVPDSAKQLPDYDPFFDNDIWLIRLDNQGNRVWDRKLGTENFDEPVAAAELANGNLAILSTTFENDDMRLIITDPQGRPALVRRIDRPGIQTADDLLVLDGGQGFVIAGSEQAPNALETEFLVIELDANLNEVRSQTFGGPGIEQEARIDLVPGDGYILCGTSNSLGNGADADIYLGRLGPELDLRWARTFGDAGADFGRQVIALPDGFAFTATLDFGDNTMLTLFRTDAEGRLD